VDVLDEARRVLAVEQAAIAHVAEKLDAAFGEAVDLLLACTGKVVVSGLGKSGLIGRKIAATLASTGTPAIFLHPSEGLHGDLGVLIRGDVAVLISNSGETEETVKIIPSIKRINIPIVALTGQPDSTLGRAANVVIDVGVPEEACPNVLVPTASTTALLAVGDALSVVLLEERGLSREDFATLHPGGTIGRRLLLTVGDIMHAGDTQPRARPETSMREAIVEMTTTGLGGLNVVDGAGHLVGILTDGDLRRALAQHMSTLLERTVCELMTRDPITIGPEALGVDAIRKMEDRPSQISVLPVVDGDGLALGLVRLHDLVRAGIA